MLSCFWKMPLSQSPHVWLPLITSVLGSHLCCRYPGSESHSSSRLDSCSGPPNTELAKKVHVDFSVASYGKIRTNVLASPIPPGLANIMVTIKLPSDHGFPPTNWLHLLPPDSCPFPDTYDPAIPDDPRPSEASSSNALSPTSVWRTLSCPFRS